MKPLPCIIHTLRDIPVTRLKGCVVCGEIIDPELLFLQDAASYARRRYIREGGLKNLWYALVRTYRVIRRVRSS